MTEAQAAPPSSLHAHLAPARARRTRLSPLEALERGFALFRSTFGAEAWRYYIASAPLVVGFIPMWVLNGQIRISNGTLLLEAALLAAAYLFRVSMVGNYMRRVRQRAFNTPVSKVKGARAQTGAVGRLLAWKIALTTGVLCTLPSVAGAAWFYGACQFASLEVEDGGERRSLTGCLALASEWFGGGLLLFLMLSPLWAAVWLNGLILAILVPQLLHSIFGLNTLLSTQMGMYSLIRSSAFWLSLFTGAWLALDPVVKCTYVVVYQHLRSRREGDDLRGVMAMLPRERQTKAQMIASTATGGRAVSGALLLVILVGIVVTPSAGVAQIPPPGRSIPAAPSDSASAVRIAKLRQALDQESQRAIYRWHDAEHPSPPSWFDKLLDSIGETIGHAANALSNFLRRLWPRGLRLTLGNQDHGGWRLQHVRLWLTLAAILTLAIAAVVFWLRRRPEAARVSIPLPIAPVADLSDSAAASERSEDEWFAIASRLEGEGELRFAVRAAYFGLLAGLEQREWLTIRGDRTNREYLNEFTRRWRRRPQAAVEEREEIPEKLRGSLRQFDRVWYGSHGVTPEASTTYRRDQREFLNHV